MSKHKGRKPRTSEEKEFNRKLGERIEMLRVKARVSQIDMAKALGIEASRLYWYEAGRSDVPPLILVKLAAQLGVTVDAITKQKLHSCGSRLQIQRTLLSSSMDNLPA